jgi:cell wall-associated NlpC family hydrolase
MRTLATALTVAAMALSAELATPGASHAVTSAQGADARAEVAHRTKTAARRKKIARLVAFARRQIGTPYAWGGTSRRQGGFDCSGTPRSGRSDAPSPARRTTRCGSAAGSPGRASARGDLAFTNGGGHVMLVASRTTAISAPRRGTRVRVVPLAQIRDEFVAGRRLLAG